MSEAQVLVITQLYEGMDNGASVLIPKFAGLIKGWLRFLGTDVCLTSEFVTRNPHIEVFWFGLCNAAVFNPCSACNCAMFVFREDVTSFLKIISHHCTPILNNFTNLMIFLIQFLYAVVMLHL